MKKNRGDLQAFFVNMNSFHGVKYMQRSPNIQTQAFVEGTDRFLGIAQFCRLFSVFTFHHLVQKFSSCTKGICWSRKHTNKRKQRSTQAGSFCKCHDSNCSRHVRQRMTSHTVITIATPTTQRQDGNERLFYTDILVTDCRAGLFPTGSIARSAYHSVSFVQSCFVSLSLSTLTEHYVNLNRQRSERQETVCSAFVTGDSVYFCKLLSSSVQHGGYEEFNVLCVSCIFC